MHILVGMAHMVEDMVARKLVCKVVVHMVVGTQACKELGMVEDMVARRLVCKVVVRMVVGTLACKELGMVEDMVEDMVLRMVEDMALHMEEGMAVVRMVEDTPVCKVLHIQACMAEGIRVCKVHKLEGMVHNNRQHNGWNSLSTRVPRHPKKATRLIFPVVFSLKDSLC
jgi:hypothetical protein